jgi:hypothetical protein
MSVHQRLLLAAILSAVLLPALVSWADDPNSWDGAWSGELGASNPWPVAVAISQAKVVSFSENGVPLEVRYSEITPTTVSFGDPANYNIQLLRGIDGSASMTIHGRHGVETGLLQK